MKTKFDKKAHSRAEKIINTARSYGSLERVAKPAGLKSGAQNKASGEAMLKQHLMSHDVMNILMCNAYRIGFKAGKRASKKPK